MKKKFYSSTVLIICSIMVFGQNNNEKPKSHIDYENINKWDTVNNALSYLYHQTADSKNLSQKSRQNNTLINRQRLDFDIEFKMDSAQWVENNKYNYTYDVSGNITQKEYLVWDSIQWINEDKYEFTYDENRNVTEELIFDWIENNWFKIGKNEYNYDGSGNITMELNYNWTENQWVNDDKDEYNYDVNGNLLSIISFFWNEDQWQQYGKYECSYNESGNITQIVLYNSNGNQWVQANKREYTYDGHGNLTKEVESTWSNSQWGLKYKEENSYDARDNLTLQISSTFHTNQWYENTKNEYTYDINNNRTQALFWQMTTSHEWWLFWESISTYDSNRNPTSEVFTYPFDGSAYRIIYTYDLSYSLSELIMPPDYNFVTFFNNQIANMPVSYMVQVLDDNGNWIDSRKKECYYTVMPSSIYETDGFLYSVYPNPTNDDINIKTQNYKGKVVFELLNLQGVVVYREEISQPKQILLNKLPHGLYLYTIELEGAGEKVTGKLIIN